MRILLADDHALVRAGLRSLLERIPGVEAVIEAGDGREAMHLAKTESPDLVLMDVAMEGLNGLDAAARILKEFPSMKVLMLSMYANEGYVSQALRAGAHGYLLKTATPAELQEALQAVGRGETYLSPRISRRIIDEYIGRSKAHPGALDMMTPRQREILQLLSEGKSVKEIAFLMNLSIKTVETHRAHLMKRLNIHDLAGLVRYAIRIGLVQSEV